MKKGWIIGIVILIVVLVAIVFLVIFGNKDNPGLINQYPVLDTDLSSTENALRGQELLQNGSISIYGKILSYDKTSKKFYCNGREADLISYKSSNSGQIGGWGSVSVVDCEDYYWVYIHSDAIPFGISGPHMMLD